MSSPLERTFLGPFLERGIRFGMLSGAETNGLLAARVTIQKPQVCTAFIKHQVIYYVEMIVLKNEATNTEFPEVRRLHRGALVLAAHNALALKEIQFHVIGKECSPEMRDHLRKLANRYGDEDRNVREVRRGDGLPDTLVTLNGAKLHADNSEAFISDVLRNFSCH